MEPQKGAGSSTHGTKPASTTTFGINSSTTAACISSRVRNPTVRRKSVHPTSSTPPIHAGKGIASDHLVGTSNGVQLRRICYTDPRDGSTYTYLTNEMTVPAYQLVITVPAYQFVIIYLCRWDIEKVFHQLKSKMEERKSWASSPEAKRAHGQFECLAHNLSLLSEQEMGELGLQDRVERKKDWGRSKTRRNREGKPMARASNFIGKAITRATQRTVRFIRWLRAHIYSEAPLSASLARLAKAWSC